MRSAKLAVTLACLITAGVGFSIGFGGLWLSWSPDYREQLKPELLKIAVGSAAVTLAAILLPIWIARHRINYPVARLANSLAERRALTLSAISSPNRDREYQRLVSELNALILSCKESQNRLDLYAVKVAHELRGPITLLQLQLDYSAKDLDPRFVEAMASHIRRLTEYVDTALFIAKVADEKICPVKTKRSIAEAVREIVGAYELQNGGQRRKLTLSLSTDQEAELDEKIFGLILHDLLSNAISHGLGEIRVRLRPGKDAATLFILNRVRTELNAQVGTGIGLRTVAVLTGAHNLRFRSRRVFNSYAAVLRIPVLPSEDASVVSKS